MAMSRESTQIRIGGRKEWVVDIQEESKLIDMSAESKHWTNHSIYLVPACIKIHNRQAYKPQVISFGPYHHGDDILLPMEDHKNRALLHFLRRTGHQLQHFVEAVEAVLPKLIGAYERLGQEWTDEDGADRFLRLMIVDGCFMLELLLYFAGKHGDYAINDPIFSNHGMLYTVPYIKRDMLMIENQIPLIVLETLLSVAPQDEVLDVSINNLVLSFCSPGPWAYPKNAELCLHPLDVVRKNMLRGTMRRSQRPRLRDRPRSSSEGDIVRSAVELNESGVLFRRSTSTSLRDISFRHGILRLPEIVVDDSTESLLLNLMAFERLHVGAGSEVTSYVFFMDNIIDSAKDVSLLNSKGIIQNALGSDKAVAKLFNTLCKDVTLDSESSLEDVRLRVNNYCSKRWNMWRANLIHTYFRSPWALLSLAAAIFLLALTVAQTVYTIIPYYNPSS